MEGGVSFTCRYCGGEFTDLSLHYPECGAKRAREDLRRLAELEAAEVRALVGSHGARTIPTVPAKLKGKGGRPRKHADRRAYMRAYMRGWRARRGK